MSAVQAPDDRRGLSCGAVAIVIAERRRLPRVPHRDTVRCWVYRWCKPGDHYTGTPGRIWILPEGVEKILAELAEAR